ncbi:MAG: DegT/DnrJ/EryC1/StrS family aminotransferase [Candidatus Krumholzibacteriia bacterium]
MQHPSEEAPKATSSQLRIPLCVPSLPDLGAILPYFGRIWDTRGLTSGMYVAELEARVQAMLPGRHVVAVNSCTSGLMLALRALDVRGDVLVPSFTFSATAHAIVWVGCRPVFVDCEPGTFNISVEDAARKVTPTTRAIVAVYVSGNPPDVEALGDLAHRHDLRLLLDAAHAMGAWVGDLPAGSFGDAEVFSLSPTKTITACEGGIVSLRESSLAEKVRIGRNYGNPGDYDARFVGLNARMSELHAVVGLGSLEMLKSNVEERIRLASAYRRRLMHVPGLRFQSVVGENICSFKDLGVRIVAAEFGATRDDVRRALARAGVDTRTYFDPPVHRQRAYAHLDPPAAGLPGTEALAREVLDLPIFPGLGEDDLEHVCATIEHACPNHAS